MYHDYRVCKISREIWFPLVDITKKQQQQGFNVLSKSKIYNSLSRFWYILAHVEREAEVLFFGEEQNEEVITGLTLFDGGIQTNL